MSATTFFEVTDAARALGCSASLVRALADSKRLRVAAQTPRGVRLFDPAVVFRLAAERAARRGR